jgi:hypothetical protein
MYTLLCRPGRLTQEYFAERRARYLPPVRVYLVLSILFFASGSIGHKNAATPPAANASTPFNVDFAECAKINSSFTWLEDSLRQACERTAAQGGKPVQAAFVANVPKMMFIFLPMMALIMLPLYWRPRRYYVEHLVFFLHTHAAFVTLVVSAILA